MRHEWRWQHNRRGTGDDPTSCRSTVPLTTAPFSHDAAQQPLTTRLPFVIGRLAAIEAANPLNQLSPMPSAAEFGLSGLDLESEIPHVRPGMSASPSGARQVSRQPPTSSLASNSAISAALAASICKTIFAGVFWMRSCKIIWCSFIHSPT